MTFHLALQKENFSVSGAKRGRKKHNHQNFDNSSLRKTSGNVTIAGYDVDKQTAEIRKIIGVQSQETTVDGDLTGRENITLQGHFHQMKTEEIKKRVDELITFCGSGGSSQ